MERLTERFDDGILKGILVKEKYGEHVPKTLFEEVDEGYLGMCVLKAYEDTGLAPEQIEELLSRENASEITRLSRDSQFGECSQREVYMKAYEDALNEDSVSEAFLADCKRVAQKYKKDNDDWMSVEERLPEKFGKYWATIRYNDGRISEPIVVDFRGVRQKYVVDTPNGREYETWGIDSAFHGSRVIAWRPYYIPEPYRPGRSNDEKK